MGKAVIAIHGGAGAISRQQMSAEKEREYVTALSSIVEHAQGMLESGASALDTVTEAVRQLEECPLFNAGIGSVFTAEETHELDACVMDGNALQAGAVAGVKHLRNPILAARLVLEKSPHVMLIGEGAEALGQVDIVVEYQGRRFHGVGLATDIVESSARALIHAINAIYRSQKVADLKKVRNEP